LNTVPFRKGLWTDVKDAARTTIGKDAGCKEPSLEWKRQILLAEHSPIRKMTFSWKWEDLPYWVSVHFVRHWLGILHFVSTSRTDRTGTDRMKLPQDNPVDHECEANVQALINISRKRLCTCASPETREAWQAVCHDISLVDEAVGSVLVRECVYRGFCPEFKCCGFVLTDEYTKQLLAYRGLDRSIR